MTWNICGLKRPDSQRISEVIQANSPDIVGLQEVSHKQLQAIQNNLGNGYTAQWSFKHAHIGAASEGLGTLARLKIESIRTVVLGHPFHWMSHHRRVAQIITLPDGLVIANVHISSDSAEDRHEQTTRLLNALDEERALIIGDLNAEPGSDVLKLFNSLDFNDTWLGGDGFTYLDPDGHSLRRIDYALGREIDVSETTVVGSDQTKSMRALSDHLPLLINVSVERASE